MSEFQPTIVVFYNREELLAKAPPDWPSPFFLGNGSYVLANKDAIEMAEAIAFQETGASNSPDDADSIIGLTLYYMWENGG